MNPETSCRYVSNRNPKQAGNLQLLPLHHSVVSSMKPGGRGTDPAPSAACLGCLGGGQWRLHNPLKILTVSVGFPSDSFSKAGPVSIETL